MDLSYQQSNYKCTSQKSHIRLFEKCQIQFLESEQEDTDIDQSHLPFFGIMATKKKLFSLLCFLTASLPFLGSETRKSLLRDEMNFTTTLSEFKYLFSVNYQHPHVVSNL